MLTIKPASDCKYDILSLGEVMLRLDPGEGRIRNSRTFCAWEGGGEYNVARALRRCFGQRAAVVTGIARNEVGLLLEDLILQGGVDLSLSKWFDYDGIGYEVRNSLNFTERGFGLRGAVGCSDRGHGATSKIRSGDVDWDYIFGTLGVRWFHTGGIYSSLSDEACEVTIEAINSAKKFGTVVSYDLNYRESLWKNQGGLSACQNRNRNIASLVDVLIGFPGLLGLTSGYDGKVDLDTRDFESLIKKAIECFPDLKVFGSTIRTVTTASINDWAAVCWNSGAFYHSNTIKNLELLDRIGGGDGFAAGLIYGLLELQDSQKSVEYGMAHGALTMTTPGDSSMVSLMEVENLVNGGSGKTYR